MKQIAVRFYEGQLQRADVIVERHRGMIDRSQVIREAVDIGLEILEKRK